MKRIKKIAEGIFIMACVKGFVPKRLETWYLRKLILEIPPEELLSLRPDWMKLEPKNIPGESR